MTQSEIAEDIVERLGANRLKLPASPEVMVQMNTLINDDTKGLSDIAAAIQKHQTLAARLLQVVNSAALRPLKPVTTTIQALSILGITLVKNLAISIAIRDMFRSKDPVLHAKLDEVWHHSIRVGALASLLVSALDDRRYDPQTAMTIGILHSIGCLPIIDYFEETHRSADDIDGVISSLSQQLSVHLLRSWGLPGSFITAINGEPCLYGNVLKFVHTYIASKDLTLPCDGFTLTCEDFAKIVKDKQAQYDELVSILLN